MTVARTAGQTSDPYTRWSPINSRPPFHWPDQARIAVIVMVSLEHVRLEPSAGSRIPPSAVRQNWGPYPHLFDPHEIAHHEYGNRVGVFRVMDVLDRHGIVASAAIDADLATRNPFLVGECLRRRWEIVAHGSNFSEMVSEDMPEDDERSLLATVLRDLEAASGATPRGWIGADYGESSRTVRLLSEAGLDYVCDWANDEQPYDLHVGDRRITALPVSVELDDVLTCRMRGIPARVWRDMVCATFDTLYADGETSGRLLFLNLHPYVIGQPFRIRYLADALAHITRGEGVWLATAQQVASWWRQQAATGGEGA